MREYRSGSGVGWGLRRHRITASIASLGIAAAVLTGVFFSAPATADQTRHTVAVGLTAPSGSVQDPAGRIWISDAKAGFCRVLEASGSTAGRIEHPLTSTDPAAKTCLGGNLPERGKGPALAGSPALLDPTPKSPGSGDEIAFIPDAAPGSAELIRAKWNPATGKFEYFNQLTVFDGDLRPNAASAGPDNNIYLSFARARSIVKITRPAGNQPSIESIASVNSAALGLSAATFNSQGRVTVFVAETTGLTTFTAPPDGSLTDYVPFASYNVGKPARVHFDSATKMLYTGTAGGTSAASAGGDTVARINLQTGVVESQWALGFSMVGGLGMKAGKLLVMDDSGQLDASKPAGQGKLYLLSNTAAQILTGPTAADGTQAADPGFTNDPTPTFTVGTVPAGSQMECSLTAAGQIPAWQDCTSGSYTPSSSQADGSYSFAVRPIPGIAATREFRIDTVPPAIPAITAPTAGQVVTGNPILAATFETGSSLRCSVDSTADSSFLACASGQPFALTKEGPATLHVKAVDAAGNVSAAATVNVTVDLTPPVVTITEPAEGATVTDSMSVQFSSTSADVAAFRCSLDGSALSACTSPKAYSGLANGQHQVDVEVSDVAGNKSLATRKFTVQAADTVPPLVTASPQAGTYGPGTTITLSANEPASIYYTTDGSTPTAASTRYADPILLGTSMTIKYLGVDSASNVSGVGQQTYVLDATPPEVTVSPAAGTYPSGQQITLTANEASTIYYTTNGSTPSTGSTKYTSPITLTGSMTLKYLAVDASNNASLVGTQAYTVIPPVSGLWKDYNSDTKADVIARDSGGTLWIYPGTGSSGFLNRISTGTGWNAMSAIVPTPDFNGDGRSDVLARDTSGVLWLYGGNGAGGWQPRVKNGEGWNGMSVILSPGDFDGNGKADVLARDGGGALWLYPGNGSGGFLNRIQVGNGWNVMTFVFSPGDFNGDGFNDVLARESGGNLYLYAGNGRGGWLARQQVGNGWNAMSAILGPGDFSGDGKPDVLARDSAGRLWLYPGNGAAGWLSRSQIGSGWNGYLIP
ncbi:chitobiase/beta-hexosaminidase C-terminal domain-containing protein [Arthrobacter sp. D1-29]